MMEIESIGCGLDGSQFLMPESMTFAELKDLLDSGKIRLVVGDNVRIKHSTIGVIDWTVIGVGIDAQPVGAKRQTVTLQMTHCMEEYRWFSKPNKKHPWGHNAWDSSCLRWYYNVFHIDDCEGIEPKYTTEKLPATASPIEAAEGIIADYASRAKLTIEHGKQNEAYYSPSRHMVSLPIMEQFEDSAGYYKTAFHELTHSTGHKTLLNRFAETNGIAAFGSESYSKEELVAEIGACGILHELGIETVKSFRNNAAYIQSWLKALKNDKKLIISATSRAEKAIRLILNIEDKADEE